MLRRRRYLLNTFILGRSGAFSPRSLFAAGEVGAWYDPSDLTTLFQDAAGTTAVTTPGQVVGLVLDKSRGLVLGPELVTNGGPGFVSTTGWSAFTGGSVAASGGALVVTGAGANTTGAYFGFPTVAGKTYYYDVTYTLGTATAIDMFISASNVGGGASLDYGGVSSYPGVISASGRTKRFFAATDDFSTFNFFPRGVGLTASITSITIRELDGRHAVQGGATSVRPIYAVEPATGRRNLLTFTEDLSNAVWLVTAASKTTAEKITAAATNNSHLIVQSVSLVSGQQYTYQQVLKYETCRFVSLRLFAGVFPHVCFDLVNGTVAASEAGASGAISNLGNGEYLCTITVTATASGTGNVGVFLQPSATNFGAAWTAVGTESVTIKKAQLELGSTATAYQRVVSQYDVTEAGVASRHYLAFDGIDDWLQTGTITPGTDKAQVFAGVRKLSDAATAMLVEHSVEVVSNAGSLSLSAPSVAAANYLFQSRGSAAQTDASYTNAAVAAPVSNVLTGIGDIAADTNNLRVNGAQVAQSAADQGTGNYLAYPLYIGRRAGTTLPFNGHLYGLIVRFGANLSASQISNAERWMARRTGVTI